YPCARPLVVFSTLLAARDVVLGRVADEHAGVVDVPAHAGVGRHAVDDRKGGRQRRVDRALHQLTEIAVREPHEAEPGPALRGNIGGAVRPRPDPADAQRDRLDAAALGVALPEPFTQQLARGVGRAVAPLAVDDVARAGQRWE